MRAPAIRGLGVLSGRGPGSGPAPIWALPRPERPGDRFRRATRECLLALAAVDAMLEDGKAPREAIAGERTALLYVTAAAYGASNREFIEAGQTDPRFNNYGGEDRMWLSPEGGPFSLWFKPDVKEQTLADWFTPPAFNEGPWAVTETKGEVRMSVRMKFTNASATDFDAELLDRPDPPRIDLAFVAERNAWNGREILQLRVKDLRLLEGSEPTPGT